jgi:conjugative relaxase-like TrwC/TraI family protein
MLSLTVISANQGETYYTAENYYSNEENQAYSSWFSKGARQLGLSGQVQGDAFKNLLHGYCPKGDKPYRVERLPLKDIEQELI